MEYIYVVRCTDNSLYTGITKDFEKRFSEHFNKLKTSAKYTKSHQVVSLEALWQTETKSDALKLEARIKKLKKEKKEELIKYPEKLMEYIGDLNDVYVLKKQQQIK